MTGWGVRSWGVAPFASVITRSCVDGAPNDSAMVETTKKEAEVRRVTMHHGRLLVCVRACGWYDGDTYYGLAGVGEGTARCTVQVPVCLSLSPTMEYSKKHARLCQPGWGASTPACNTHVTQNDGRRNTYLSRWEMVVMQWTRPYAEWL